MTTYTTRLRCHDCKEYLTLEQEVHNHCCPYCGTSSNGYPNTYREVGYWKSIGLGFWPFGSSTWIPKQNP